MSSSLPISESPQGSPTSSLACSRRSQKVSGVAFTTLEYCSTSLTPVVYCRLTDWVYTLGHGKYRYKRN